MITTEPNPHTGGRRVIGLGTVTAAEVRRLRTTDLRDAYFGPDGANLLVLDGIDFRGYDLRNTTLVDGFVRNCDFSTAQTDYLYSRRMQWEISNVFPTDTASVLNHDIIAAIVGKALVNLAGVERDAAVKLREHLLDLSTSWKDSIELLMRVLSLNLNEVERFLRKAFTGYPKLIARLDAVVAEGEFIPPRALVQATATPLPGRQQIDWLNLPVPTHRDDRWEIERLIEAQHESIGPINVHIYWLQPEVKPIVSLYGDLQPNPPWGWWRREGWEI